MARVLNVDIPENKRAEIALTHIYGIGRSLANEILKNADIDPNKKIKKLTEEELTKIRQIAANYVTEGTLRREKALNIKRLMEIGCYRGVRHRKGLPVNGQRTRSNSRTRKGPRKTVANKKKATQKT